MYQNKRGLNDEIRHIWQTKGTLARLILINVLVFVVVAVLRVLMYLSGVGEWHNFLVYHFSLPADISSFFTQPWSIITYAFLHEGIFHILFNMLVLYWFGKLIAEFLAKNHLRNLYILGAISAGLFYIIIYNVAPYYEGVAERTVLLGASGAVYAAVTAAATLLPEYSLYLIFIGPVRIKYIALAYVFLSFISIVGTNSGGALAHLGGALLGYVYIKYMQKGVNIGAPVDAFFSLFESKSKTRISKKNFRRSSDRSQKNKQTEIDEILDKISESGYSSLTKEEKEKLFRMSRKK